MIPEWLNLSQRSGNSGTTQITVTVGTNWNEFERFYLFTVKNNANLEEIVILNQSSHTEPQQDFITVTPNTLTFAQSGGTGNLTVSSSTEWYAVYPNWISGATSGSSGITIITVTVDENLENSLKTDEIQFSGSSIVNVEINQNTFETEYEYLNVNPQLIYYTNTTGNTDFFYVDSNTNWTITYPNGVTGTTSGSGSSIIYITTTAGYYIDNYITIRTQNITKYVHIVQFDTSQYESQYLTMAFATSGTVHCSTPGSYRKNGGNWTSVNGTNASHFTMAVSTGDIIEWKRTDGSTYGMFGDTTGEFIVYGNIMSIIYGDNFQNFDGSKGLYLARTFQDCTGLTSALNLVLPATTLNVGWCYTYMFMGCISLVYPPRILPALTLPYRNQSTQGCYEGMFAGCTSLIRTPILPAEQLQNASGCYKEMFRNCTSLEKTPVLQPNNLSTRCFDSMFRGCTSLSYAFDLQNRNLYNGCYIDMFHSCTGLTKAPELPATALAQDCYRGMFWNCSSLNYIKCLATDLSATDCLTGWVYGVTSTGTFVKASGTSWSRGYNSIPNNWIIKNSLN